MDLIVKRMSKRYEIPDGYADDIKESVCLFFHQRVYDPTTQTYVYCSPLDKGPALEIKSREVKVGNDNDVAVVEQDLKFLGHIEGLEKEMIPKFASGEMCLRTFIKGGKINKLDEAAFKLYRAKGPESKGNSEAALKLYRSNGSHDKENKSSRANVARDSNKTSKRLNFFGGRPIQRKKKASISIRSFDSVACKSRKKVKITDFFSKS